MDTEMLAGFDIDRRLVEYGTGWQKYVEARKAEIDPTGKKTVFGDYRVDGPNTVNFAVFIKSEDNVREYFWNSTYPVYISNLTAKLITTDDVKSMMLAEIRQLFYKTVFNDFIKEYMK